jgi:hypothetical protein
VKYSRAVRGIDVCTGERGEARSGFYGIPKIRSDCGACPQTEFTTTIKVPSFVNRFRCLGFLDSKLSKLARIG